MTTGRAPWCDGDARTVTTTVVTPVRTGRRRGLDPGRGEHTGAVHLAVGPPCEGVRNVMVAGEYPHRHFRQ
ncbi:hypothetical protein [Streptomyces poonensis]|uniref:Uncharacterized protein n=1 Tax=Streptomyces poonensis TaxID=68255 RepID=A0A918QDH6_9ACTN|nr:hypothetical protein [Streptomyces poonensis]GGZ40999.1 hypothetical protein GCM10010365_72080 [Streptomyces poonensis]GLJ91739.1 hypothetical protein GCM10017589_43460 [Streptomyces poonensis]